jgi:hypothetical protein
MNSEAKASGGAVDVAAVRARVGSSSSSSPPSASSFSA